MPDMRPSFIPLVLTGIHLSLPSINGVLVNITVDDTLPDPLTGNTFQYAPIDQWSLGNDCSTCLARPDPSFAKDGTWHDTTYLSTSTDEPQTAQIQFNGKNESRTKHFNAEA